MSRVKSGKGGKQVRVGEAASRVGEQVYHTGQGQDERAEASRPRPRARWPQHGLDSAWSGTSNPHRESGTRCRAAADVGLAGTSAGTADGRQKGRDGNRLGDSVGAQAPGAGEGVRSAERPQRDAMGTCNRDSGGVLSGRMRPLGRLKCRGLIISLVHPHAIDDAHPDVGQRTDGHTVGLALCPLALVIVASPLLLQGRLPGELVQSVAQRFHAGEAFVRFGVIAALERHGRRSGQGLDGVSIGIATAVIAPFGQQTWSQALARTRQRPPDLLVRMGQKKGADSLVIASNLLEHDQQLLDQREHQARLGAHDNLAGLQLGTMHLLEDLGSHLARVAMLACAQGGRDRFKRGGLCGLRRGIGLQKHQGGTLLHLGKQVQGSRIVLASGRPSAG
jgi:hypothetical protein